MVFNRGRIFNGYFTWDFKPTLNQRRSREILVSERFLLEDDQQFDHF